MKHIIRKILYRSIDSTGGWYDIHHIPGSGSLVITDEDDDNGTLRTYDLRTAVRRMRRTDAASLTADLQLIITYDNGLEARLGTSERPVRLAQDLGDYLTVSCSWSEPVDRRP